MADSVKEVVKQNIVINRNSLISGPKIYEKQHTKLLFGEERGFLRGEIAQDCVVEGVNGMV